MDGTWTRVSMLGYNDVVVTNDTVEPVETKTVFDYHESSFFPNVGIMEAQSHGLDNCRINFTDGSYLVMRSSDLVYKVAGL